MSPWKRLALAVLVQAVKDYAVYHSAGADKARALLQKMKDRDQLPTQANFRKYATGMRFGHFLKVIQVPEDPGTFLFSHTRWHDYADVDPDKFLFLQDESARKQAGETIHWNSNQMDF